MTAGSRPKGGGAYVVTRDVPPQKKDGPRVYITAPGHELREGGYTEKLALARRWRNRPAVWRWLKRRQAAHGFPGQLDPGWYSKHLD